MLSIDDGDRARDGVNESVIGHFEDAWRAVQNSCVQVREYIGILQDIHDVFRYLKSAIAETQRNVYANFLLRSHSAFLSAGWLASSGQLPDAYALSRTVIEASGYAYLAQTDERLMAIWARGANTDDDRQRVRNSFSAGKVRRALLEVDERLAASYEHYYSITLAYGGHTNVQALANTMMVSEDDEGYDSRFFFIYGTPFKVAKVVDILSWCGVVASSIYLEIWKRELVDLLKMGNLRSALQLITERLAVLNKANSFDSEEELAPDD